jgi:hypothetical protein
MPYNYVWILKLRQIGFGETVRTAYISERYLTATTALRSGWGFRRCRGIWCSSYNGCRRSGLSLTDLTNWPGGYCYFGYFGYNR